MTATFATYNVSMYRDASGALLADLGNDQLQQARFAAAVLQEVRPDVLLLNEVDYDADGAAIAAFQQTFLGVSQAGGEPLSYPHVYIPETNTGEHSGFDLDNDGTVSATVGDAAYGGDAWGYGEYPGKYGLAVLSMHPIDEAAIRTFRTLTWASMPDNRLPTDWYDSDEAAAMRLSSKTHADVPVHIGSHTVHFLVSHPTPPTFDGTEDRNGRRNHDEIRFWADYLDADWMTDDAGLAGGLDDDASFVIAGDLNADPNDGDSTDAPVALLLDHTRIQAIEPRSEGAVEAAENQGRANTTHTGEHALDTTDFDDNQVGNLRIDYVLPSTDLSVRDSGVFWPKSDQPGFEWVGRFPFPVSDHRLVFATVDVPQE
ncbi:MAG: endonuclease/exonuclease/phosphatase family protein [Deltaproteobacteria bacterium]|nr:MAG: endonuclease/exonuclease/phosphatase family protein [Deltaproteobacteria bacterium]